ncbi:RagB/SusD family nutrient uptake outer membrane protein [Oscillatoria amoena NRMC-F 0135]|nr:RagB/SusD family nutrient uptake outer membrane protein [Oscillatoria amoena NRMC-F 0135]
MKKIIALTLILIFAGCTDLDLKPANGDVDAVVFTDFESYRKYMAKVYAAFSLTGQMGPNGQPDISIVNDEGFTSYIRSYWKVQELPTDEAVVAWTDAGIQDLNKCTWSSTNQFVRVLYYRIFYIIAYANDFLGQSTDNLLNERGITAAEKEAIKVFRAEVRFLRALAYWHALDIFRNVPLVTSITAALPTQVTPAELFDFIESELAACEVDMAEPMQNEYGRADKAANWMLQAKIYLNAEVYGAGNHYTEAVQACEKIINEGYSLAPNYFELFMADNHQFATTEFIFTLPADGLESQSWGSTTFLVHAALGERMVDKLLDDDNTTSFPTEDVDLYGVSGGWGGLRTTSVMVSKFSGATIPVTQDPRARIYTNGQTLGITDLLDFKQGYAVPKYSNLKSTGGRGSNVTHCDTDYPLFRLADVYLMYAEAVLRGGTGSLTQATTYINLLRERAYGDNSANITEPDLTLDFVLDERVRELYWEATRRVDLIRYNYFSDRGAGNEKIWPWKGGVAAGESISEDLEILPIPASDMQANPKLIQNPGY